MSQLKVAIREPARAASRIATMRSDHQICKLINAKNPQRFASLIIFEFHVANSDTPRGACRWGAARKQALAVLYLRSLMAPVLDSSIVLGTFNGTWGIPLRQIPAGCSGIVCPTASLPISDRPFRIGRASAAAACWRVGAKTSRAGRLQAIGTRYGVMRSPARLQRNRNTVLSAHRLGLLALEREVRAAREGAEGCGGSMMWTRPCVPPGETRPAHRDAPIVGPGRESHSYPSASLAGQRVRQRSQPATEPVHPHRLTLSNRPARE